MRQQRAIYAGAGGSVDESKMFVNAVCVCVCHAQILTRLLGLAHDAQSCVPDAREHLLCIMCVFECV